MFSNSKREAFNIAFNYWSTYADLTFEEARDGFSADIVIEFRRGDHDDGYPFDGPSNFKHRFLGVTAIIKCNKKSKAVF